ncbi:hypothetical protein DO944_13545 [Microbacterium sp. SMR1]|nr:hypothetical protein DO944_13545 [Microbacterium sp. SMR1]
MLTVKLWIILASTLLVLVLAIALFGEHVRDSYPWAVPATSVLVVLIAAAGTMLIQRHNRRRGTQSRR